jgi:peptidoglycan/LPS O-acetylase OafA/YrhL
MLLGAIRGRGTGMSWRADIDGLRALAVISVVLFHAGVPFASGGYVGVDVFFVISGFLITGLIRNELNEGRFRFSAFYLRRARRILPTLLFVIAATLVAGAVILLPLQFYSLSVISIYATFAASNFHFVETINYFAPQIGDSALLHTWSLAVEEQFYLVFPLLLFFLRKRSNAVVLSVLAVVAILSFALCVWGTNTPAMSLHAFYLAPYRAWEFALGAMLVFAFNKPGEGRAGLRNIAALIGLGCIAAPVVWFDQRTDFPGFAALLPCMGAALLLWANTGSTWVRPILSSPPFVFVGRISYSLYLWHWPVLKLWERAQAQSLEPWQTAIAVLAAFLLSCLSYYWIEQPIRTKRAFPKARTFVSLAAGLAASIAAFGAFGVATKGWTDRFPDYRPVLNQPRSYRIGVCLLAGDAGPDRWGGENCIVNPEGRWTILLWGDSFAAHYTHGLERVATELDARIVLYSKVACPPLIEPSLNYYYPTCNAFEANIEAVIERYDVDTVIMAGWWQRYLLPDLDVGPVTRTVEWLNARDIRVVLISQSPTFEAPPADYAYITGRDRQRVGFPMALIERLQSVGGARALFEPYAELCADGLCPHRRGGRRLFAFNDHLSNPASDFLVRRMVRRGLLTPPADTAPAQPVSP